MIFSRIPGRALGAALAAIAVAMIGACGGGTSQYEAFQPKRLLAFGDETSVITANGQRYAINGLSGAPVPEGEKAPLDCIAFPVWVQSIASLYGFVFAECNPGQVQNPQARMLAIAGAKATDIKVQLDAQIANGGFFDGDLATVLAGANDVIELYKQYPGRSEQDLEDELRARGKGLALQINRLVDFGVKVIVSTVPDMGLTPYANKQRLEFTDTDRAALLSRMTAAFNEQLGVNIVIDGRFVGLVQGDLRTQAMVRSPSSFGLVNVVDGACQDIAALPDCDTTTLVVGATTAGWLWADDLRLSFPGHQQLATLAIDRARRNPF